MQRNFEHPSQAQWPRRENPSFCLAEIQRQAAHQVLGDKYGVRGPAHARALHAVVGAVVRREPEVPEGCPGSASTWSSLKSVSSCLESFSSYLRCVLNYLKSVLSEEQGAERRTIHPLPVGKNENKDTTATD